MKYRACAIKYVYTVVQPPSTLISRALSSSLYSLNNNFPFPISPTEVFLFSFPLFLNLFFNWRKIALQCCDGLCHTTWISHNHTCITSLLSLPSLPPSHPSRSSELLAVLFFFKLVFNWRIIAFLYCVYFCHTSTWISHGHKRMFPLSWASLAPPSSSHPSRLS